MKIFALILALVLVIGCFAGCADTKPAADPNPAEEVQPVGDDTASGEIDSPVVGGWSMDVVTGAALDEDQQAAFDAAIEGYEGMLLEPVALLGTQVVAGSNYAILCKGTMVVPDAEPALKVVIMYNDLSGNHTISNVKDFVVTDYTTASDEEISDVPMAGGWTPSSAEAVALEDRIQQGFEAAAAELTDVTLTPIAVLGSQVVAGSNYALLCRAARTDSEATALKVVVLYVPVDGEASFTNVAALNIGDFNQ